MAFKLLKKTNYCYRAKPVDKPDMFTHGTEVCYEESEPTKLFLDGVEIDESTLQESTNIQTEALQWLFVGDIVTRVIFHSDTLKHDILPNVEVVVKNNLLYLKDCYDRLHVMIPGVDGKLYFYKTHKKSLKKHKKIDLSDTNFCYRAERLTEDLEKSNMVYGTNITVDESGNAIMLDNEYIKSNTLEESIPGIKCIDGIPFVFEEDVVCKTLFVSGHLVYSLADVKIIRNEDELLLKDFNDKVREKANFDTESGEIVYTHEKIV